MTSRAAPARSATRFSPLSANAISAAISAKRGAARDTRLAADRPHVPERPRRDRTARVVCAGCRAALPDAALLSATDAAADDRDRLLLAALCRHDRGIHR